MNCPKCREPLRNEIYRQKDYKICFYCEGTWLNKQTVIKENILDALEVTDKQTEYNCPDCIDINLVKAYSDSIELEHCKNCAGIFFDMGEIEKAYPGFKDADTDKIKSDTKEAISVIVAIGITVAFLVKIFKRE
jgi:Zn-finger nucleic acid-binding protein